MVRFACKTFMTPSQSEAEPLITVPSATYGGIPQWRPRILGVLDGAVLLARALRKEVGVSSEKSEAFRFLLSSMTVQKELAAASGSTGWRDNQYGSAISEQWFADYRPSNMELRALRNL